VTYRLARGAAHGVLGPGPAARSIGSRHTRISARHPPGAVGQRCANDRATPTPAPFTQRLLNRGEPISAYDQFEADLAARGCAALGYCPSGDMLEHLCVVHLTGAIRVIVAFESANVAYVVLVGRHDDSHPLLDVYRQRYALAGHEPPVVSGSDNPDLYQEVASGIRSAYRAAAQANIRHRPSPFAAGRATCVGIRNGAR
jgi:hypothetical protein